MRPQWSILPISVLSTSSFTTAFLFPPGPGQDLRLNQIQVIGTHNSYHREVSLAERNVIEQFAPNSEDLFYSHASLSDQLSHQQVRSLELDLHSDTEGGLYASPLIWRFANITAETAPYDASVMQQPGLKVFHITDLDTNSVCRTFVECLTQLRTWSRANRKHLPITVLLELKADAMACSLGGVCAEEAMEWTLERILNVDREIQGVLERDMLIVPDDVRQEGMTLEESVLQEGWPGLWGSRGKFMFLLDNDPGNSSSDVRTLYRSGGHESLQDRMLWTNAVEGEADCAFLKRNSPDVEEIQRLVDKGYFVRTRADEPLSTMLERDTMTREMALESGAQIVSTDFPRYGMSARWDRDYAVQLEEGKLARCNAVAGPEWCRDMFVQE